MASPEEIQVEVVYARPERCWSVPVTLGAGATLRQAITASGILEQCPEIDLAVNRTGIFGRMRPLDAPVQAGERVEIYRGLKADPKEARRKRVAVKKPAA